MTDPLGLSIGMTNLVAARVGHPPVSRRSILTVFNDRAPETGLPSQNPNLTVPGLVLTGFAERVGDPVPLVAADGSAHRGDTVLAEALDAMARTVGGGSPVAVAVPSYWGPAAVGALRGALRAKPGLTAGGMPPALIPDSAAALAALQVAPGLPDRGIVVLCDFGGSGTSVTLADAGADFATIGQTQRYPDFSGDQIDQALLNYVLSGIAQARDADPAGTAAVGSLARLRDDCRIAKERLSAETASVIPVELPGFRSDIRVTRTELEQLVSEPLAALLDTIEDMLQRNNIPLTGVSAAATVGGTAAIPVITQRLSERLRTPVVTTPQPGLNVATGAALMAERGLEADAPTGLAPTGLAPAADTPTSMGSAAWAAGAAGLAAGQSASDGAESATFRALAWSQDDATAGEPVRYDVEDYTFGSGQEGTEARPQVAFSPTDDDYPPEPGPLPWYKRPPVLFGAAAAAALLAIGGLAITLTGSVGDSTPVTETETTLSMEPSPEGPPPPTESITTVTVGPDGQATTTVVPPPPPPPTTTTTTPTTTTTSPTTTTTTTTTTSTTTTTPTTTTTTRTTPPTTTTTQPPVTTTTKPPVTTTQPPVTTTQPPVTTTIAPVTPDEPSDGDGAGAGAAG